MADFLLPSYQELTRVTLRHAVTVHGISMPAGASGVIMAAYADGQAYEVEFDDPHAVLTIEGRDLGA